MKFQKRLFKIILALILVLSRLSAARAQYNLNDSLLDAQAKDSIITVFNNALQQNTGLYNGSEYFYTGHNVKGFPYFKSADLLNGSVFYGGNLYTNVPMHFDLVSNQLVILDYTKNYPIQLVTSQIEYFIIDSSLFINAGFKNDPAMPQAAGFYEVLYNGKAVVYAKKQKQLVLSAKADENDHYTDFNWYYIYMNNHLYRVSKEKNVLDVFSEKKSELKKFINGNQINFRKNFEEALVKTAAYYDKLKN